jgi:hypothetical protein
MNVLHSHGTSATKFQSIEEAPDTTQEDRVIETFEQIKKAYRAMTKDARYRPAASSDGMGGISLSLEELKQDTVLEKEAATYAKNWRKEEDAYKFWIGCGDAQTRPALVFTIEAARNLCAGRLGDHVALRLLKLAVKELEHITKDEDNDLIYRALKLG